MILAEVTLIVVVSGLSLGHASETPQQAKQQPLLTSYDFIIVGAGSAGSVMANRLARAPGNYSVLLLEAGGEMTENLNVPFYAPFSANEANSWGYETEPQRYALWDFPRYMANITQGKVMGGTSSLNSMNYVRGSRHDFDNWEKIYNATGWNYENVLKYFKQIEKFKVPGVSQEEIAAYHGLDGETPVNYPRYHTPLSDVFLQACNESHYEYVDYNGKKHSGYSRVQANTEYGVRMGASTCFLHPEWTKHFKNLHISINSTATKITFQDKRATHVTFKKDQEEITIAVNREVIVCAGAVGSPKLLMLSGIGPEWHLKDLGIPVVASLPVGQGLQDHMVFLGLVVTTNDDLIGLRNINQSIAQYAYNQTGLLTIPGAFEAVLFTHSNVDKKYDDYPDIEMELAAVFPNEEIARSSFVSEEIYDQYYKAMINKTGFMCAVAMVRPDSRGMIYLRSKDPEQKPAIDPKLLSAETKDLFRIVNGTMRVKELFNTEAMKKVGAKLWDRKYPRCKKFELWSEDYVTCFIQHTAFPGQHLCCTCGMGNHEYAVVDENLRVKGGVKNVRVADSSAMPAIIAGNTNAAVMMIAAKGADLILKDAAAYDAPRVRR
ncbi:4-pyridoxate dehydrogenase-like [Amblyomma americanum]